MSLRVSDIFMQKLNEVQNKVALRINNLQKDMPSFQECLSQAVNNAEETAKTNNKSVGKEDSFERAKISLAKSSAYIPKNRDELMGIIDLLFQNKVD